MTKSNLNYRIATPLFLWGLAVSAVIVGEFAGWNEGLLHGGIGGMVAATLIVSLMFGCLSATLSELATAMPYSGGAFAYSRAAFSPTVAFFTGVSQIIEYLCTLATVLASIEITTQHIVEQYYGIHLPTIGTWIFYIVIFAILSVWDSRLFYRSALALSVASLAALVYFCIHAIPLFDVSLLLNIPFADHGTMWMPNGIIGVAWCLPFAVWLFVVIEIITLAPEDTAHPSKAIPRAFYASYITILIFSVCVLFLMPGVGKGALDIGGRNNAYIVALDFVTSGQLPFFLLFFLVISGPLAGYHSTVFAASKITSVLGRGAYLPSGLARVSQSRQTPYVSVIVVSVIVLLLLIAINFFTDPRGSVPILLNMSILGAIITYTISFLSYIVLTVKYPGMNRPYMSPLGITGAIAGLIITAVTTALMFTNPAYITALSVCVVVYVLALVYYFVFRKRKIRADAPEESFAQQLQANQTAE